VPIATPPYFLFSLSLSLSPLRHKGGLFVSISELFIREETWQEKLINTRNKDYVTEVFLHEIRLCLQSFKTFMTQHNSKIYHKCYKLLRQPIKMFMAHINIWNINGIYKYIPAN
jgi:hypothetical protein